MSRLSETAQECTRTRTCGLRFMNVLKAFDSLPECEEYLGGTPVHSRFGQVTKVRFGKLKRRLLLDVKQSRVTERTRKVHVP